MTGDLRFDHETSTRELPGYVAEGSSTYETADYPFPSETAYSIFDQFVSTAVTAPIDRLSWLSALREVHTQAVLESYFRLMFGSHAGTYHQPARFTRGEILKNVRDLLDKIRYERFDSAFESSLSMGLRSLMSSRGSETVTALEQELGSGRYPVRLIAEALRSVGRNASSARRDAELHLLVKYLGHSSALVRDSAGLALVDLEDARGIQALDEAAQRETEPQLKRDLLVSRDELTRCISAPPSAQARP